MSEFFKKIGNFFYGLVEKLEKKQEELKVKKGMDIPLVKIVFGAIGAIILILVVKGLLGIVGEFLFGK